MNNDPGTDEIVRPPHREYENELEPPNERAFLPLVGNRVNDLFAASDQQTRARKGGDVPSPEEFDDDLVRPTLADVSRRATGNVVDRNRNGTQPSSEATQSETRADQAYMARGFNTVRFARPLVPTRRGNDPLHVEGAEKRASVDRRSRGHDVTFLGGSDATDAAVTQECGLRADVSARHRASSIDDTTRRNTTYSTAAILTAASRADALPAAPARHVGSRRNDVSDITSRMYNRVCDFIGARRAHATRGTAHDSLAIVTGHTAGTMPAYASHFDRASSTVTLGISDAIVLENARRTSFDELVRFTAHVAQSRRAHPIALNTPPSQTHGPADVRPMDALPPIPRRNPETRTRVGLGDCDVAYERTLNAERTRNNTFGARQVDRRMPSCETRPATQATSTRVNTHERHVPSRKGPSTRDGAPRVNPARTRLRSEPSYTPRSPQRDNDETPRRPSTGQHTLGTHDALQGRTGSQVTTDERRSDTGHRRLSKLNLGAFTTHAPVPGGVHIRNVPSNIHGMHKKTAHDVSANA